MKDIVTYLNKIPENQRFFISTRYKGKYTQYSCALGALSPKLQELEEEYQQFSIKELYECETISRDRKLELFFPLFEFGFSIDQLEQIQEKNDCLFCDSIGERFEILSDYMISMQNEMEQ